MRLDLTKWGGSKLRKRLEALDPTQDMKDATSLFFPFEAEAAKAINDHEDRLAALEARPVSTPFPASG